MVEKRTVTIETKKRTLSVQIDENLIEEFVRKATHGPHRRMCKTSRVALESAVFLWFCYVRRGFREAAEVGGSRGFDLSFLPP